MSDEAPVVEAPVTPDVPVVEAPVSDAPVAAGDTTKAEIAKIKSLDAKFDDHEVEIVIDGEPVKMSVKELKAVKQKEVASNKRFQQAADIEKKVKAFLDRGKEVPEELLAKLGIDPEEFAESLLRRKIEEAQLSPQEKKEREMRKQFEEEKQQWEGTVRERVQHEIDTGITEAFKTTGLPKSPFLVARIAAMVNESIKLSQKNGEVKPLSFSDAAVKVKEWFVEGTRQTLKSLPLQERLNILGDDIVNELMQHRLTQVGQSPAAPKMPTDEPVQAKNPNKTKKVLTPKEWREYVDSL
jgi:hypothetical protein